MQTNGDVITNEFSVEVNLIGSELNPARITEIVGLTPVKGARAGEQRNHGAPGSVYEEGFWSYEVTSTDDVVECRDHQLICLADALSPHREALRDAGVEKIYFYYTLSSFIGLMNVHLKTETMKRLCALDAELYISCFDCFDPNHEYWRVQSTDAKA